MAGIIRPVHFFRACSFLLISGVIVDGSSKSGKRAQLKFSEDGYFKILQLADLHYGHFGSFDDHTDKVGAMQPLNPLNFLHIATLYHVALQR